MDELVFYPQFCLKCQLSWLSKVIAEPCIWCGSRRTVNYLREILGEDEEPDGELVTCREDADLDMKKKQSCKDCSRRDKCGHRKDVESGKQIGCPLSGCGDNIYVYG